MQQRRTADFTETVLCQDALTVPVRAQLKNLRDEFDETVRVAPFVVIP